MKHRSRTECDPIDIAVGARIRIRRRQLGLSQSALADAIGLTFQQVQKYERGANRISASKLVHAAKALKVPVQYFFPSEGDGVTNRTYALIAFPSSLEMLQAFAAIPEGAAKTTLLALTHAMADGQSEAAGSPVLAAVSS